MRNFRAAIDVSPYPDGVTWWLRRPLIYYRHPESIRIPRGFETDFASVPRLLQSVFPRWARYGPASVVHDWLYWNQQTTRAEADAIFLEAMVYLGVGKVTRWLLHLAVRGFGHLAWTDNVRIAKLGYSRVRTVASPAQPTWKTLHEPLKK